MKGIKTREIAQLVWKANEAEIKDIWHANWDKNEIKGMCKDVIRQKYGNNVLKQCSATFLGYCMHYVFVQCVNMWGPKNN